VTVLAVEITNVDSDVDIACVGSTVEFDADTEPANKYNCVKWVGGGDPYRGSGEIFRTEWDTPGTKTVTAWGCGSNKSKDVIIFGGEIQPQDDCPNHGKFLLLWNPASSSSPEYYSAPSGQPSGTTYKWEISSGASNAEIDGSDTGSSVSLKPLAEGDLTLKLTYTYEEHTCIETLGTAVQKPNKDNSYVTCGTRGGFCQPGKRGAYRNLYYHIRDGAGRPIPHARWDEWWHFSGFPPPYGCCWSGGDWYADCDGKVRDHLGIEEPKNCDNCGLLCSDRQTIKVSGWLVSGHFWDNNLYYYDKDYTGVAPFIKLSPHCTD
jgi:hypothetical protein